MPPRTKDKHSPIFPYRFSFNICDAFHPGDLIPTDVPVGHSFCRWALNPDRALEWNDQGKGKGVTILTTDGPERCCSDYTPRLILTEDLERPVAGPGKVYRAHVVGYGWYTAAPGTDFVVRLATNKEDVPKLRAEAMLFENEMLHAKTRNPRGPVDFHGFYQTDARDAAAMIFQVRNALPEGPDFGSDKKPRKKKGKKKHPEDSESPHTHTPVVTPPRPTTRTPWMDSLD